MKRYRWGARPPDGLFRLNRSSRQAGGLINWWPVLGGVPGSLTLRDYGEALNLTGTLTATNPTWTGTAGRGLALSFPGTGTVNVTIPANAALGATTRTICMWVYPTEIGTYRALWGDAQYEIYISVSGQPKVWPVTNTWLDTTTVPVNQWSHLALTATSTDLKTYLDAVLRGTWTATLSPTNAASYIGAYNASTDPYKGYISDVRVYNRVLSQPELHQLYDPATRWELYEPVRRVWRMAAAAPAPTGRTRGPAVQTM